MSGINLNFNQTPASYYDQSLIDAQNKVAQEIEEAIKDTQASEPIRRLESSTYTNTDNFENSGILLRKIQSLLESTILSDSIIDEMKATPAQTDEIRNKYNICKISALCSRLAYKLPEETRSILIEKDGNDCVYQVLFLNRTTGLQVDSRPAVCFFDNSKPDQSHVIICIPGTETLNDWLSNLSSNTIKLNSTKFSNDADIKSLFIAGDDIEAHFGFTSIALGIIDQIISSQVKSILENAKDITICGHSQGGAVASLLTFYFETHRNFLKINPECKIDCVTFGSPRVFTKAAYQKYSENCPDSYRINNQLDPVPLTPFGSQGFKHVGKKLTFTKECLHSLGEETVRELGKSVLLDLEAIKSTIEKISKIFRPFCWPEALIKFHSMTLYETTCKSSHGEQFIGNTIFQDDCLNQFESSSDKNDYSKSKAVIYTPDSEKEESENDHEQVDISQALHPKE